VAIIGRIEIVAGDAGWPRAEPLLEEVWSPAVVATLPWKDVVWAHADWRLPVFNPAGESIAHIGTFLRDAMWDGRPVRMSGVDGVATREDCRQEGIVSAAMRRAAQEMRDTHGVDFALLFCEPRHAPVYEKLGWRKFGGDVRHAAAGTHPPWCGRRARS
jgi:aminoglycoside 2'-N-acetyltransferase I